MRTTLNGVAKPWAVFVEAIVARENMPTWDSFGMTLCRRRPGEGMYRVARQGTKRRRRMWLL